MKTLLVQLATILLLCSCASPPAKDKPKSETPRLSERLVIIPNETGGDIYFILTDDGDKQKAYDFFQSIEKAETIIKNKEKSDKTEELNVDLTIAGEPVAFADSKTLLFGRAGYESAQKTEISNCDYKLKMTLDGSKTLTKSFDAAEIAPEDALNLYPIIEKNESGNLKIGLFAVRNKTKDEYLPDSEKLRVIVRNFKGKTVWNSSEGLNFMQVITPVYPEAIGEFYEYSVLWKNPPESGEYTAQLIIPANPEKYVVQIKMEL